MSDNSPVLSSLQVKAMVRGKGTVVAVALRRDGRILVDGRLAHALGTRHGDYRYTTDGERVISVPGDAIDLLQRRAGEARGKGV
jgi:adenylosuccinate synthase